MLENPKVSTTNGYESRKNALNCIWLNPKCKLMENQQA